MNPWFFALQNWLGELVEVLLLGFAGVLHTPGSPMGSQPEPDHRQDASAADALDRLQLDFEAQIARSVENHRSDLCLKSARVLNLA